MPLKIGINLRRLEVLARPAYGEPTPFCADHDGAAASVSGFPAFLSSFSMCEVLLNPTCPLKNAFAQGHDNVRTRSELEGHPKVGASWEGFVLEEIMRHFGIRAEECFFWATHAGAELDLLIVRGKRRLGFEVKRTSSPRLTPSMRSALADLGLQRLYVIHAGEHSFDMGKKVSAIAFHRFQDDLAPLTSVWKRVNSKRTKGT